MKTKPFIFFSFLFFLSHNAFAGGYGIFASELKLMPSFCRGLSIQNLQNDAKHLHQSIKVPGQHTQHFCHGMKSLVRANRLETRKKGSGKGYYNGAVDEFDYVQNHSTKKHSLIPATSLYKATALEKLGRRQEAIREYNKAISLKKRYPHAYSKLSDYYLKLGLKKDALATIQMGLKYSPKSKSLQKRLKKLNRIIKPK